MRNGLPKIPDDPALWKAYRETRDDAARNRLVVQYIPFVEAIAKRMIEKLPRDVQVEDLIAAGTDTLFRLVDMFDPTRGIRFTTYANLRIKGGMLDYLRTLDHVPRLTRSRARKWDRAVAGLRIRLNREPTSEEIRESMGLSETLFSRITRDRIIPTRSLTEIIECDTNRERRAAAVSLVPEARPDNIDEKLDGGQIIPLMLACGRFKLTEVLLLRLHYFDSETLNQIGGMLKISESRVSQIHADLLRRLRFTLKAAA